VSKHKINDPKFKSRFEEWIWECCNKYNHPVEYEPLKLSYRLEKTYIPDFRLKNGIIIEAKGRFDADMRRKMLAVKRAHPELDIRFVFQNAQNKLSKKAKMKYWEWAELHHYKWAEGSIPPAWFKEKRQSRTPRKS
jgi:hypothetical protein